MMIAARHWRLFGLVLLVLAPLLLLRAEGDDFASRTWRPADNVPPVRPRGLTQRELLGIDPHRLILYAPMPPDPRVLAIPRR
jgi:hypothetical protein